MRDDELRGMILKALASMLNFDNVPQGAVHTTRDYEEHPFCTGYERGAPIRTHFLAPNYLKIRAFLLD